MKSFFKQKHITAIVVDVLVSVAGFFIKPATDFMRSELPCSFNDMGILCPSCGGTRCVGNFVRGNFAASWHYHPFFFCVCVYIIISILCMNLGYIFKITFFEKLFKKMLSPTAIISIVIIFVIYGLVRVILSYFFGVKFI